MIAIVLNLGGWILVAIVLDGFFQSFRSDLTRRISKHSFCQLAWSMIGVGAFLIGSVHAVFQLLAMAPVAFVQLHLSDGSDDPITLRQVKSYARDVWQRLCARLKP